MVLILLSFSLSAKSSSSGDRVSIRHSGDSLLITIPKSLLGEEYLVTSVIESSSDTRESTFGAIPSKFRVLSFGATDTLLTINESESGRIPSNIGLTPAIIDAYKIINKNDTSITADISKFFTKENKMLFPQEKGAALSLMISTFKFDSDNTFISGISTDSKSYGHSHQGKVNDKFSVYTNVSYKYSSMLGVFAVMAKDEPFTALVKTTFTRIPKDNDGYTPLITRLSNYIESVKVIDYSPNAQRANVINYATRWGRDTINVYASEEFPPIWRESITEAVNIWDNALTSKSMVLEFASPEEEYGCIAIRFNRSKSSNSTTTVWANPNTGEIFYSDILFNSGIVKDIGYDILFSLGPYIKDAQSLTPSDTLLKGELTSKCLFEIGKALGLKEDLCGSNRVPTDSLHSPYYTKQYGISGSIMDITGVNYSINQNDIEKGLYLHNTRLSPIDIAKIKYLYGDDSDDEFIDKSLELEDSLLKLEFSEKEVTHRKGDLGDDPVKASHHGINSLYNVVENVHQWLEDEDFDYTYRGSIYIDLVLRYGQYINNVTEYIKSPNSASHSTTYATKFILDMISEVKKMENETLINYFELDTQVSIFLAKASIRELMGALFEKTGNNNDSSQNEIFDSMELILDYICTLNSRESSFAFAIQEAYLDKLIESDNYLAHYYLEKSKKALKRLRTVNKDILNTKLK